MSEIEITIKKDYSQPPEASKKKRGRPRKVKIEDKEDDIPWDKEEKTDWEK